MKVRRTCQAVLTVAACAVAGVGAVFAYGRTVSKPARDLADGLRKISSGVYDVELAVPPAGPLKDAVCSFNEIAAALNRRNDLQIDYLSNVSHEFKTPLSYIQSFAMALQDDDLPEDRRKAYVHSIEAGVRRLSAMVRNLLELTIVNDLDEPEDQGRFSLDELIRHVMAVYVPIMDQKGISYDTDLEDVSVLGNEVLLGEVWANLLSNSVKFSSNGDEIVVGLKRVQDCAVVTVADTGLGMDDDQVAQAFNRFYRAHPDESEGAGLGLAIAKTIVEKHGGSIELKSELGQGTTCTVVLPLGQTG